jgi:hypothetical protein
MVIHNSLGFFLLPNTWSHSQGPTAGAENLALTAFYKQLQAQQTHWKGLVFAGEFDETIRLIRRTAAVLANGVPRYLALQRKNIARVLGYQMYDPLTRSPSSSGRARWESKTPSKRKQKKLNKALADAWLTYSFEIRPLIKDLQEGAETIARWQIENKDLVHTEVNGYGRTESPITQSAISDNWNGFSFQRFTRRKMIVEVKIRAGYRGEGVRPVGSGDFVRLAELAGFAPRDFIPSVWNLLPWSFFVDYFVNVGDLLSAMCTATDGITWSSKTYMHTIQEDCQTGKVSYPGLGLDGSAAGNAGGYTKMTTSFTRTVISTVGIPTVQFRVPSMMSNAWVNTLALLQGRRG